MTLTHSLLKVLLRDRTCMALARTFKSTCICLAYRPITFSCTASLSVAARSMGKRKQEIDLESDGIEEEEEEVKPKKPRAPRAKKATEPCVDEQGYSVEPPSLIWKCVPTWNYVLLLEEPRSTRTSLQGLWHRTWRQDCCL